MLDNQISCLLCGELQKHTFIPQGNGKQAVVVRVSIFYLFIFFASKNITDQSIGHLESEIV